MVTITNHLGESMDLELRFPEKSGFLIQNITGLGPSKANINMIEVLSLPGGIYNSSHVSGKNLLFMLAFMQDNGIEETRIKSYKYFPLNRRIKIGIQTDSRFAEIYGYVESNEITFFSKQQVAIISVVCPSSYFNDTEKIITLFTDTDPNFEFPFSNESTTLPLINFGEISTKTENTVFYDGDASTGVIFYIHATGTVTDLQIANVTTQESLLIDTDILTTMTGSPIINGDDIIISTLKGAKFITLIRAGVTINIRNTLGQNPKWFQLEKGDNVFVYSAGSGASSVLFKAEHQNLYEGL